MKKIPKKFITTKDPQIKGFIKTLATCYLQFKAKQNQLLQ